MKKFLLITVLFLASCGGGNDNSQGPGGTECPSSHVATTAHNICLPKIFGPQTEHQIDRPDGGVVMTELPVADARTRAKIAEYVVAGLQRTIDSATHHNPSWTHYTTTGSYQAVLVRKQATNMDGTPALVTRGIQTAGTVINVRMDGKAGPPPIIVLPQPDNFDAENYWPYLQASARHEGEHVIEYTNALGVFLSFIGAGDVHPHWAMPGLAHEQGTACLVGMDGDTMAMVILRNGSSEPQ